MKFNDYFEFPRDIDMEPFTELGLAKLQGEVPLNVMAVLISHFMEGECHSNVNFLRKTHCSPRKAGG